MVSSFEFFMGFSRYYNSLGISFQESIATSTSRIVSYVDSLGRMLGYRIFSELSYSKLFAMANEECPPELSGKRPDVCWGYFSVKEGNQSLGLKYELVLESEQTMNEEKIEEDIKKLLFFPANHKVLYCAHDSPKRVVEITKNVAKRMPRSSMGNLLLIIDPWVDRKTFSKGELVGFSLDSNLEGLGMGKADVTELDDGDSKIRLFTNAKWGTMEGQWVL